MLQIITEYNTPVGNDHCVVPFSTTKINFPFNPLTLWYYFRHITTIFLLNIVIFGNLDIKSFILENYIIIIITIIKNLELL